MEEKKFEISGEIEGSESNSEKKSIVGRFVLFLLIILVIGSVWYFPFLQDEFPALKRITMGNNAITADTTLLNENFELQEKIDSLQLLNDSLVTVNEILFEDDNSNSYGNNVGIYYEVQIGIFRHFDSDKYTEQTTGLNTEKISSGESKVTLGKFTDQSVARDFLKDIKKMGFKDAWVVAKENGERVAFDSEAAN